MVFSDKGECDGKENEKGGATVQPFGFYAFVSVGSVLERHRDMYFQGLDKKREGRRKLSN